MHYNCWRYYDPNIGRYLKLDPIGFKVDNNNLYGYVFNNPISGIDPSGESLVIPFTFIVLVGITVIVSYDFLTKPLVKVPPISCKPKLPADFDEVFTTPEGVVIIIPGENVDHIEWCKEQILDAEDYCIDLLSKPDSGIPRGVRGPSKRGGWRGVQDCVEGLIPESCKG